MQIVGSSNAAFDPRGNLEERLGRALTQEVLDERVRRRTEMVLEQEVLPGVAELAAAARDLGVKTGVASSSTQSWVREHLDRLGILALFDCIRCRDDVPRVKPAPDLFLATLECLGVEPHDAVAIEDSPNGIIAAKTAEMLCVAVPNSITAGQDLGRVDVVLSTLSGTTPESLAASLGLTVFRCESGSSPAEETRPA